MFWRRDKNADTSAAAAEVRLRDKYISFRRLLELNSECLELMAGLQEDLQYVPPLRGVLGGRVASIFEKAQGIVESLGKMTGTPYPVLAQALKEQQQEVESYIGIRQESPPLRLAVSLSEIGLEASGEVGGKAAALGEIKNKIDLPVPNGYVLTTEAYRHFCGIPLWASIRDSLRQADLGDLEALQAISAHLTKLVMASPVPRAVEVAIIERARMLGREAPGLAVRSSAVGEGGIRSFAGQFLSLINVPPDQTIEAYKRVVAGRFSEGALSYRLSTGLPETESPMAVLFLPVISARAAGILYTRDPFPITLRTITFLSASREEARHGNGEGCAPVFWRPASRILTSSSTDAATWSMPGARGPPPTKPNRISIS